MCIGAYFTQDPEIYNISKAYIQLGYLYQNPDHMTMIFNRNFKEATDIIKSIFKTVENSIDNKNTIK